MKNTEKEIMERFQKFDFDKNEAKQAAVYKKITAPAPKKQGFGMKFAYAASFCVLLLAGVFITREVTSDSLSKGIAGVLPPAVKEKIIGGVTPVAPVEAGVFYGMASSSAESADGVAVWAGISAPAQQPAYEERAVTNTYRARSIAPAKKGYSGAMAYADIAFAPAPSVSFDYNSMQDESYKKYAENTFFATATDPLSTFSSDVDTASYGIVKNVIQNGGAVNPDSVRIEEFINYFDYNYPQPKGKDPVSINMEYTDSPWNKGLKLVKIGVKAKDIEKADLPAGNLVFLIDVSGSMESANRLPLVKKALRLLVEELRPQDRVSIVTYANGVSEVLSGAKGNEKEKILSIVDNLRASGGTSGSAGLAKAYEVAKKNFIRKGNNRIILATDGDFNIGPRSEGELENQITKAKDSGVFLSVLGFGMGNYKDSKVQTLANKGNGNYAYINDLFEAKKVFVKEFGATLFTVAKDVKIQVEFNPGKIAAYRLVGYEKRKLENQDFNDDKKDAGEMGAGHTVTVLYEVIPAGVKSEYLPDIDSLKYAKNQGASDGGELLTVKLRYKDPDSDKSKLMEKPLNENEYVPFEKASDDMRFAAGVAQFGQLLKNSTYKGSMTVKQVVETAKKAKGADEEGYRAEFIKIADLYSLNNR